MDRVCVLVPTYNGEKYIIPFLESLKKQSYRPIRVLISDDLSTDKTVKKIKNWVKKNGNSKGFEIELIENKKNVGLACNLARMRKKVIEEYVFLADQDDIWHEKKIALQVKYLQEHPEVIECLCDRSIIDKDNHLLYKSEDKYRHIVRKKMNFQKVICNPSIYAANAIALRNKNLELLLDVPDTVIEPDTYITVMASTYGFIDFVHKPLVYYRIHGNNLSASYTLETKYNYLKSYYLLVKKYKRIRNAQINDGKIISQMLKKKRNINLEKYSNKLLNYKTKNPYVQALNEIFHIT